MPNTGDWAVAYRDMRWTAAGASVLVVGLVIASVLLLVIAA